MNLSRNLLNSKNNLRIIDRNVKEEYCDFNFFSIYGISKPNESCIYSLKEGRCVVFLRKEDTIYIESESYRNYYDEIFTLELLSINEVFSVVEGWIKYIDFIVELAAKYDCSNVRLENIFVFFNEVDILFSVIGNLEEISVDEILWEKIEIIPSNILRGESPYKNIFTGELIKFNNRRERNVRTGRYEREY